MKRVIVSHLLILTFAVAGCAQAKKPSDSPPASSNQATVDGSSIDPKKAHEFSDGVVQAILEDRYGELRQKMEQAFRDAVSEKDMKPIVEKVYSMYGKPLEAEFKNEEIGYRMYENGERKPLRKYWYVVRTSKHEKGTAFLFTEIVPDGESLACVQFSIVTFPLGIPPSLR
jgi:predicted small lipoprotein YifL